MIQFLFLFFFLFAFSIAQQGNDHILLNQLSSSTGFTCFITRYENLRCWGYERRFAYLGHGNITNVGLNDKTPTIREQGDIDLGENVKVKSVATGETATCVLLQDETIKCWGNGIDGVLGDGSDSGSGSKIPKDLPAVNISAPVKQLAMGYNHVCVVLELKSPTESNVKCWGKNDYGQLGFSTDNVTSYGNTPETIPALLPFVPLDGPVFMIAASQRHTCAVMEVTRDIKCWGDNSYAQLGAPSLTVQQLVPPVERVPLPPGQYGYVAAGPRSSCAIEENARALYCWGTGSDGQLGYGGTTNLAGAMNSSQSFAVGTGGAVKFPDGAQVTKVTIGAAHTCALLGTGDVSCFGRNVTGQLGAPIPDAGATPTTTPDTYDPVVLPLSVTALSAGFDHSCAELKNGDLYCWGSAQLGATGFNDMDKTVGASFETLPITHGLVDVGDDVITTTTEFVSTTTTTEQPTTISETTSRTFSDIDLTPTKAPEEEEDLWWLWLLIAILVCCCLICLLLLILFLRRRNKDDEQEDSQRRKGDDVGLRPGTAVYVEQDQQPQAVVVDSSSSSSSSSSYSSSDSEEQRRERKSHKKKSKKSRKKRSNK